MPVVCPARMKPELCGGRDTGAGRVETTVAGAGPVGFGDGSERANVFRGVGKAGY